ncbi:TPA: response regulator transcription factor [Legionella pneumophila]|nr:helix-turn-helix transcriptional regulator [Legionella pneumophila]MDW8905868.1 helix-turn-helix transcriptional regulator [Legionella pneumophila]HAU1108741.1 helix-turn-helix transcriptional regulator [Legionella pneumophila]HDO7949047.1 helix-turn-helix transcriptional regulator [Legionella pneumophila]HDO7951957.1 helix-turn-helix transcriptional regulator [Legionella pneumophila]
MHSVSEDGTICVNLDDYNELSDSIRFREKIDYLTEKLNCPKEISNFSISMLFRGGQRYYISNLYLWAIPYRTEGLFRGDVDHDHNLYNGKEFFIQREIKYDEMQIPIIQILESRYKLSTTFAMVRQCEECDFIIEAYNNEEIKEPRKLYYQVRDAFEKFICLFLDAMLSEITTAIPGQKWLNILNDSELRKNVIMRKIAPKHFVQLTKRELQCLSMIANGMTIQKISDRLHLSTETVKTHAKSIRNKMNCINITEAVSKAFRHGLLS